MQVKCLEKQVRYVVIQGKYMEIQVNITEMQMKDGWTCK
jgi:hypothetical protein